MSVLAVVATRRREQPTRNRGDTIKYQPRKEPFVGVDMAAGDSATAIGVLHRVNAEKAERLNVLFEKHMTELAMSASAKLQQLDLRERMEIQRPQRTDLEPMKIWEVKPTHDDPFGQRFLAERLLETKFL